MGLRIKDYFDTKDLDVLDDFSVEYVLRSMLSDDSGDLSAEHESTLQEFHEKLVEYHKKKRELQSEAYDKISNLLYQTDEVGLHTEQEMLRKIRSIKEETQKARRKLTDNSFPKEEEFNI